MRILYDSKNPVYKKPFGVLRENENCRFGIHIPKNCKTKTVKLELFKEDGGFYAAFFLSLKESKDDYEFYSTEIAIKDAGLYFYRFYIVTETTEFPLLKEGYDMTNMCAGDMWQLSCIPSDFKTSEGFKGRVMYQIFPDRFCREGVCDTSSKLKPFTIHKSEEELPEFRPNEEGEVLNCDFFGGNLKGIAKKIPYLARLGVSVIYLNPIFKAYSNHRYDTADYKKIDEMLGTEEDFSALCKKAHLFNIKIILDGVFSHTGSNSVYFDSEKVFKNGAASNPDSPYREWYDFKSYPDDYTSWWGIETLPCVNEMNESYVDYIIDGEDSVVAHWLRAGADGFRLDVADELPDEFIKKLRIRMKQVKEESLLIGEVWEDASNKKSYGKRRKYFVGGELDSVMNYPFRNAIIDFVSGKDKGEGLKQTVMTIAENYPRQVVDSLMNILSTHDTPRILSVLSGVTPPQTKEERAVYKLSQKDREKAEGRLKCAAFLQFVLPGMPCIYYGDEIGTEGFEDPFCRTFFDWKGAKNSELKEFYTSLCHLHKTCAPLKDGAVSVEMIKSGVVKICRKGEKSATAYINCSRLPFALPQNEGRVKFGDNGKVLSPMSFVLFEK